MVEKRSTLDIDLDGISPDEAFSVLGNDIRLDIVRVLWQAGAVREYDEVIETAEEMAFSELRREVDLDDNGRFNYHLSQLTPHFVRRTDDGYRLSGAGKQVARTVIAVSGTEDLDRSRALERDCPLCDAPLVATYEDQWLRVVCTECEGIFGDEAPEGTVYLANYPAATLSDQDPDEAVERGLYRCMLDLAYTMHDICRECASPVSASVSVCGSHEGEGNCDACGTPFPVWGEQRCDTCGFAKRLPVGLFVMGLTPVIAFLEEQGVDVLAPSFEEIIGLLREQFEITVSEDPLRVSTTIESETGRLTVVLNDEMDVVELDRRSIA